MPCSVCSHTLHKVCRSTDGRDVFWCPRCGTLRTDYGGFGDDHLPKLVERCRQFEKTMDARDCARWHSVGIKESIEPKEQAGDQ